MLRCSALASCRGWRRASGRPSRRTVRPRGSRRPTAGCSGAGAWAPCAAPCETPTRRAPACRGPRPGRAGKLLLLLVLRVMEDLAPHLVELPVELRRVDAHLLELGE